MLHGLSQDEDDPLDNLDVTQLDITSQEDYILDEAAGNNVWSFAFSTYYVAVLEFILLLTHMN